MKIKLIALSILGLTLNACQVTPANLIETSAQAYETVTLSDEDVKKLSDDSCANMDSQSKIARPTSPYTERLNKIAKTLGYNVNGTTINYKVYITEEVNAWAMANGCVRVYSGLMDKMTDNEIQGVLGHELGHVALGHAKKAIQVAYATQLTRGLISASTNSTIATLSQSQLGDLTEKIINSRFSQKQETQADNYSFSFLVEKGINPIGIANAFDKLDSGKSSILSTHPSSKKRAENIRQKIDEMNAKNKK